MEVKSSGEQPWRAGWRSKLRSDFLRSCAAVALGAAVALLVGGLLRWDSAYVFWTFLLSPVVFLLGFLHVGSSRAAETLGKAIGAEVGWVAFIVAFVTSDFYQWHPALRVTEIVVAVAGLVAASLVAAGLVGATLVLRTVLADDGK